MKILFYDMGSYLYNDILETMKKLGHTVRTVYYHFDDRCHDDFFCTRFSEKIRSDAWDVVFSVNFFPLVAKLCSEYGLPYISWSCDSPLAEELENYFDYGTNYIYLFDKAEVCSYQKSGHSRVFYSPLAVNTERIENLKFNQQEISRYSSDISFVGSLYTASLDGLLIPLDDYLKGYIYGALEAQFNIYGANLLDSILTDTILENVNKCYSAAGTQLTKKGLEFAIQKQITFAERVTLLGTLSEIGETKFYSTAKYDFDGPVKQMGPVKYSSQMPAVFKYSKLNLCPTLRSIVSGIPLRDLDILSCGGVLLTNYQPELLDFFTDKEDLLLYNSLEEAVDLASWYLKNEEERLKIAGHALPIIKDQFSYAKMLPGILKI